MDIEKLTNQIASDIYDVGYSIVPNAIPDSLALALYQEVKNHQSLKAAGIGRDQDYVVEKDVRGDKIAWIESEPGNETTQQWLALTESLRSGLNRTLMLGLFNYESHYAVYEQGDFYQRHKDAFRGQKNRILSTVLYLNPDWNASDGGELVLYQDDEDTQGIKVVPNLGTLVVFLSEEFPHEVLPANHTRYSIAGWFRVAN